MPARPILVTLAIGALLLAALIGGGVGASIASRPAPAGGQRAARPGQQPAQSDPALAQAIAELAREVRLLNATPAEDEPSQRVEARDAERAAAALDPDELIAALDRLALALHSAPARVGGGGFGITPMVVPAGKNVAGLLELVPRATEEISREHRFWTIQQVLDRYGPPDEVSGDNWVYEFSSGEDTEVLTFMFSRGYLVNIWN